MKTSEQVWQEYHSRLRVFARSRISDNAAVDDVLQNVFLKMHVGLNFLKDESKLRSWLFRIARNAIIDYYRTRKPFEDIPEQFPQREPHPAEKAVQELADCLQPMVQLLPETYRDAVILSELKGLTQRQVADMQGISLSGAKSRVQRGRMLLKNMLDDCCRLEFDQRGRLTDYEPKGSACGACRHPPCVLFDLFPSIGA